MNELQTLKILSRINLHQKVRKILIIFSYFLILAGILTFLFFALNKKNQKYKLVSDFKKNYKNIENEKIMINPKTRFQYNENEVYDIIAKSAKHKNNEEVTLFDVFAEGKIGNITAGKLEITDNGNNLIFSQNPVLILNDVKN